MQPQRIGSSSGHLAEVERKKGPVFYVKYRLPDGRQVRRALGPVWKGRGRPPTGHYTQRMAEDALREILADGQRGRLPGQARCGATFGQAADEWLRWVEHDRKRRHTTVVNYRNLLEHEIVPTFGRDTPLEAVDVERVDAYRRRLVAAGRLADRTINKRLLVLHALFRRAQRVWGLPGNPVAAVERQPGRSSGDFAVLDASEVAALARAATSEQDGAIFTVAAFTGLRMGELRALRWMDADFSRRLVHVRRNVALGVVGDPKSGRVRSVPMVDQVLRALDGLSRRAHFTGDEDRVFCSEAGGSIDDSALRRRFKDALDAAGLKRLRFHDLRHSFGSMAVRVFPLSDVKAFMGHADISTTMVYVHHIPQHDAADRLSRAIAEGSPDNVSQDVSRTEQISDDLS